MSLACKICIISKGVRGTDKLPENEEELIEHLESYHHMPVRRQNETAGEAVSRFLTAHPEARTCPDCAKRKAPWAITQ